MMAAFRVAWSSSPRRTFIILPIAAATYEVLRRRSPVRWVCGIWGGWGGGVGVVLMAAGYGLYRSAGQLRQSSGGGGPGFSAEPERLVTAGPYAVVRNPMYLGHLVFLAGLVALTRSPAALAGLFIQGQRFSERVAVDERRLADRFGHEYVEYTERVPRWSPRITASPYVLYHRIAEPASAAIRLRVVELGLKSHIDFQNAETDGKDELARLGGHATPALWDGTRLISGVDAVERELARLAQRS